jgi:hypothetical protein
MPGILEDGLDESRALAGRFRGKAVARLANDPTEIVPWGNDVHFLELVLTHVRDDQPPSRIERVSPGVSQAIRPNFTARTRPADERVVGGDRVVLARVPAVYVDAEHAAEQGRKILPVPVRVSSLTSVPQANVEHAVRPKDELSGVVIGKGLLHLEENPARFGWLVTQAKCGEFPLGDASSLRAFEGGVIDVEKAVFEIVGMESQTQQAELGSSAHLHLEHELARRRAHGALFGQRDEASRAFLAEDDGAMRLAGDELDVGHLRKPVGDDFPVNVAR